MHDLTGYQRDCLYVIAGLCSQKGLAIKDEFDDNDDFEVNHGRLYLNLNTLVEKGLIEKYEINKRTGYYHLTNYGRRGLQARGKG